MVLCCRDAPDLLAPHVLRALAPVRAVGIHSGPTASHFVVRDVDGTAWLFGRSIAGALGPGTSTSTRPDKALGDSSAASNGGAKKKKGAAKGKLADEPSTGEGAVSENAPYRVRAEDLPGGKQGERIVHAACGRSHTLLVSSLGTVWAAGANTVGQVRRFMSRSGAVG
jgi:alpha-tubulin suppressor-like RCC1 family protein